MSEGKIVKEERNIDKGTEMPMNMGCMSQIPQMSQMPEMSQIPQIPQMPQMMQMSQMPQMMQMSQMPQMMQMPQMPQMMQMPQQQVMCCPFLMNMQCPLMQGMSGYNPMLSNPYAVSPYNANQGAQNSCTAGQYGVNSYMNPMAGM